MKSAAQVDPSILAEAADWLTLLADDDVSEAQRAECEQWRQRSPEHARAWARAQKLLTKLDTLPPAVATAVLNRSRRRKALPVLLLLLATVSIGWAALQVSGGLQWGADFRAGVGERSELQLEDRTEVILNTSTAVDVRYDKSQRLIVLRAGEIVVRTAPDANDLHRPFIVGTEHARMEALGTRFSVSKTDRHTCVAVFGGAVRVEVDAELQRAAPVLRPGERICVGAGATGTIEPADEIQTAWTRGMFVADRMRLADVVRELDRYRRGRLNVDPAVADLLVSGAFPVDDPERALHMLMSTYPVSIEARLGGYWLTLVPAR
ncbi:MAG TPA: FecR family protein [Steroidobacter sp.]|nr:FecR family protein [Steroidobacter sp.]